MSFYQQSPWRGVVPALALFLIAAVLIIGWDLPAGAQSTNSPPATPLFPGGVAPSHRKPRPQVTQLSGAELYSIHCNRCHPERYPTERTAAQWKTILLHMRVRANLPAAQARTILKYLQDNSGR